MGRRIVSLVATQQIVAGAAGAAVPTVLAPLISQVPIVGSGPGQIVGGFLAIWLGGQIGDGMGKSFLVGIGAGMLVNGLVGFVGPALKLRA